MTSPIDRRNLKTRRAVYEAKSESPGQGQRLSKLKAERGLSPTAERPVEADAIAGRTRGRPWSKPGAPSD